MAFKSNNGLSEETLREWVESQTGDPQFNTMPGRGDRIEVTAAQLQNTRIPNVSPFARENLLYIQSICRDYTAVPGFYVDRWSFNSYLMLYTLSGEGTLRLEEKEYTVKSGDCCLIDCRTRHYYGTVSKQGWRHHILHLNGKDMEFYYSEFMRSGSPVIHIGDDNRMDGQIQKLIQICNQFSSNEMSQHKYLTGLLVDLILGTEEHSKKQVSDEVARVCAYIESHYTEALSLDLLAGVIFQSKYYLSRVFKAEIGVGISQYLNAVRINAAKDLLAATEIPVATIGEMVGYAYPHYFISVFKDETGKTPKQFRLSR